GRYPLAKAIRGAGEQVPQMETWLAILEHHEVTSIPAVAAAPLEQAAQSVRAAAIPAPPMPVAVVTPPQSAPTAEPSATTPPAIAPIPAPADAPPSGRVGPSPNAAPVPDAKAGPCTAQGPCPAGAESVRPGGG